MSIESLEGKYEGERIFLIGNGPSLDETPLHRLDNEYSLAMNKIHGIYENTSWRPSFYLFGHSDLNSEKKQYVQHHIDLGIPCFINSTHDSVFGDSDNIHYFDKFYLKEESPVPDVNFHELEINDVKELPLETLQKFWSDRVGEVLYTYHSMYAAIQLAWYMGFDEMYLIGCDLGDIKHTPHMLFDKGLDPLDYNQENTSGSPAVSFAIDSLRKGVPIRSLANGILFELLYTQYYHIIGRLLAKFGLMDDDYHFGSSYIHQPRDMSVLSKEITKSHVLADAISQSHGFQIFNATVGGNLEVYPRVNFNTLV